MTSDDKADPQVVAQAARDFIDNRKILAMAGRSSLFECAFNAPIYKRRTSSPCRGGADPVCYRSPSIAPVSSVPYTAMTGIGLFVTNPLKSKNLAMLTIVGGTQEALIVRGSGSSFAPHPSPRAPRN